MGVDKGSVGRLDIADPNLAILIGPDLGMLPGKNLGVEIAVYGCWNGLGVCLAADAQNVGQVGNTDVLLFKGTVQW